MQIVFPSFDLIDGTTKSEENTAWRSILSNNIKNQILDTEDKYIMSVMGILSIPPPCSLCGKNVMRDDVLVDNCPECVIRSVIET